MKQTTHTKRRTLLLIAVPLAAALTGGGVAVAAAVTGPGSQVTAPGEVHRYGTDSSSPAATATPSTLQDRDRVRDGSCLESPSTLPTATAQHTYQHEYEYQHHSDVTDK